MHETDVAGDAGALRVGEDSHGRVSHGSVGGELERRNGVGKARGMRSTYGAAVMFFFCWLWRCEPRSSFRFGAESVSFREPSKVVAGWLPGKTVKHLYKEWRGSEMRVA